MKKNLNLFSLIMITVIAVDSLRTIPISAQFGYQIIFFYLSGAILFLLPCALTSAELVSTWPENGGIYIWIKKAFGDKTALFIIWLQWIYNICWYPTILALLASTIAYNINPALSNNKIFMFLTIITVYWIITWINAKGINASSKLSDFCAILGTLLPMICIAILAIFWLAQGNHPKINFASNKLIPNLSATDNWILLSNILYSLVGIEITAYHAKDVASPQRNYPLALLIAVIIILLSLIISSLSVAIIIPKAALKLSLIHGFLDAFYLFLKTFNLLWAMPILSLAIIIGIIGGVGAWIIGPSKGLLTAAQDKLLPKIFTKTNKHEAPINILIIQGIIFTIISFAYIMLPTVNSAFFVLSILTAQLALLGYIFIFAAVLKLRYKYPNIHRPFKIPGKTNFFTWIISIIGISSCIITIVLSFIPPVGIPIGNKLTYEIYLITGFISLAFSSMIIFKLKH